MLYMCKTEGTYKLLAHTTGKPAPDSCVTTLPQSAEIHLLSVFFAVSGVLKRPEAS